MVLVAIIYDKTYEGIEERTVAKLSEEGFDTSPGSVARLFSSIINSEIIDLYEILENQHKQSFVSTAEGSFLDSIGFLVNCARKDKESDDFYRTRISEQVQLMASSNELSIRLTALNIEGVDDVYIKNYSQGAGTFTVIVTTKNFVTPEELLIKVHNELNEKVALGVNFNVEGPVNYYVSLKINLIFKESTDEVQKKDIKMFVKENIYKYINSMKLGENLIINELTQRIMETSDEIVSYYCLEFKINGQLQNFINQESKWTGRFIIEPQPNAVIIE